MYLFGQKEILLSARQNQALRAAFPAPSNDEGAFLFSSQVRHQSCGRQGVPFLVREVLEGRFCLREQGRVFSSLSTQTPQLFDLSKRFSDRRILKEQSQNRQDRPL